jgi:hypothetical protein
VFSSYPRAVEALNSGSAQVPRDSPCAERPEGLADVVLEVRLQRVAWLRYPRRSRYKSHITSEAFRLLMRYTPLL